MKNKSVKILLQKALPTTLAAAMTISMAVPASAAPAAGADPVSGTSAPVVSEISDDNVITTTDDATTDYASNITFTTKNADGSYTELSLEDAKTAVADGKTVNMYDISHEEGYGSVWNSSYDYTDYRTGIQIGDKSEDAIGTEGVGGVLSEKNLLSKFNLTSTSKNFNPIVVNKADATLDNPVIVAGNEDGEGNSDGNEDVNDFVGYGTAVTVYGDTVTTGGSADADGQQGGKTNTNSTAKTTLDLSDGGSITTYGVARPAVEVDNGGDVIIKGDGDDSTQEISVNGGTLYDGYKNTADTTKMVSPPWVLGVVGNSRATNMLGKGSSMVVQDSNVYAKSWGVLSTDSGSNPYLYAINSTMDMNLDESKGEVSGYGTYAIGNAQEYFLGSTFNVPTYLTIAANGDDNNITLGATAKGETITTKKAVWNDDEMSVVNYGKVVASETRETVVNSENFGLDIWGQATVNVNDATVFNTKSAAFLVKSASATVNIGEDAVISPATDENAEAEKALNGTQYGVVFQVMDNEDSAAKGISFPDGYAGPVFSDAEYTEAEGWLEASASDVPAGGAPEGEAPEGGAPGGAPGGSAVTASELNIANKDLKGNIYNGSGYCGTGQTLTVNIQDGAKVTGAISSTTIKHTTDGGQTQNTSIKEADYDMIGHVMNKPYYNGSNDVVLNVDGTWVAQGTSYVTSLTLGKNANIVCGSAETEDGKEITLKAGKTYENVVIKGDSSVVTAISNDNVITTTDGATTDFAGNITFTTKNEDGSYTELSLEDAKEAIAEGKTVNVYDISHKEGYGSVWNSSYDYTDYRTGIQIGDKSEDAIGTEGVGGVLSGNLLSKFKLTSTSKNFNPIVVNNADATLDNPVIVAGNADGKDNSDGNEDVNDFVGYGTAVTVYGDTVTTGGSADADGQQGGKTNTNSTKKTTLDLSDGGSITTYGVARPAVEVDNGGDVIIKGDGDDSTQEISVNGGTLYDGYKNTADTTKMVSPPWVLGVVGNSRATNMLGKGSSMVVQDSNVYAKSWGVLSTDSGSNPYLYAINSTMDMNLDESKGEVSGYGTYAIGNAQEYFLGSTFNVPTYLTIAANGDDNNITLGATKKGETITTKKAVWNDDEMSVIDYNKVVASETRETVVNSENFGLDIWGQANVYVNDATVFNTKSAAFMIKGASSNINISEDAVINAATDANAEAEKELNGTKYGVIYQIIDNEDSAAKGISFPDGYAGPVFSDAEYTEAEGWLEASASDAPAGGAPEGGAPEGGAPGGAPGGAAAAASELNIANKDLKGNIYNGSGYYGTGQTLTVNIQDGAKVTGAISSTTIKHTTDGGQTQNTSIKEADYDMIGHVMNKPYYNGSNDVIINVDGTWVADGTSYVNELTLGKNAKVIASVYDENGNAVTLKEGKTYKNVTVKEKETVTAKWVQDSKGWWYQNADGSYPANQWAQINGKWYHFDARGYMQIGWQKINNKWYYLGSANDGSMKSGWQKINNKWYYLGSASDGSMKSGWQKISGNWYYLGSANDGAMKTGWQQVNGKWYYFYSSGAMASDTWIGSYYVDASGAWIPNK